MDNTIEKCGDSIRVRTGRLHYSEVVINLYKSSWNHCLMF